MGKDTLEGIREDLDAAASALHGEHDPAAFARRLASLVERLERGSLALLKEAAAPSSPEERLYARALDDYASLQQQLARVRDALGDRARLLETLRRKGSDPDVLHRHIAFVQALDLSLQHLVHLMQYDIAGRHEVDIRQGFQLTSGSTNYGRFYFAPPKKNSGK